VPTGNVIPQRSLIVCEPIGRKLPAEEAGAVLALGMARAGAPDPDVCPLPALARRRRGTVHDVAGEARAAAVQALAAASFDARMLDSRSVIILARALEPRTLAGSLAFEVATRARQSGVPCYAVTARDRLGSFDARVLDLQVVIEASTERELERAGRELAAIV
jgi:hypothetical protein